MSITYIKYCGTALFEISSSGEPDSVRVFDIPS
ncbi:hypothetical protein TW65_04380 [Stemphylium lycopersici]|nr:hypothetical protein TW65_04380 [Stemphylium lycopersici]